MQISKTTRLIQIGKWTLLSAGILGAFFSFVAWLIVPGGIDFNRLLVAGLFGSLAINAFLLSAIFFHASSEGDFQAFRSTFRTPPMIISGLFLLVFVLVGATAPWWSRH